MKQEKGVFEFEKRLYFLGRKAKAAKFKAAFWFGYIHGKKSIDTNTNKISDLMYRGYQIFQSPQNED